jgi:hypothetical protein
VGTKWVFHNKQDEHGGVTRNKVRLVAKDYSQVEGLDFDKTFPPEVRLESIHILHTRATHQAKKKCMWSNHLASRVKNILTMFINSIRCSMGLIKHQEHGMNALGIFSF